jgi:hypothetical protein
MAWDKEDDDDSGSVLLGATVRPKGLDFDREKRTCMPLLFGVVLSRALSWPAASDFAYVSAYAAGS